jgi:hypothetical protein
MALQKPTKQKGVSASAPPPYTSKTIKGGTLVGKIFHDIRYRDLKADFIFAHSPCRKRWTQDGIDDDKRSRHGVLLVGNSKSTCWGNAA